MNDPLGITVLNHATVLLEAGPVRLLVDPWLEGHAFSGGWELARETPTSAWDAMASATHLWVSHWHSDHLHVPTLAKLAARRPDLRVLANDSHNFTMVDRFRALGFTDVRPIGERERWRDEHLDAIRFPTAAIDNMLSVELGRWRVLIYNDCNLPLGAVRRLRERLGPIDVALLNYNHAGRLFTDEPAAMIEDRLWSAMVQNVDALGARFAVPYASFHRYRSRFALEQNASLIDHAKAEARCAHDRRLIHGSVGRTIRFERGAATVASEEPSAPTEPTVLDPGPPLAEAEVLSVAQRYVGRLAHDWWRSTALLGTVRLALEDRDLGLELDFRAGEARLTAPRPCHARTDSPILLRWMEKPFGDDTFLAGAHFGLGEDERGARVDPAPLQRLLLLSVLSSNHLGPSRAWRLPLEPAGRAFLWARREEILATALGRRFRAGELRS
jgi:L-ascorbate metabolism protein UlaG (beta-lactamase superfamily)